MPSTGYGLSRRRQELDVVYQQARLDMGCVGFRIFTPVQVAASTGVMDVAGPKDMYTLIDVKRNADGSYNRTAVRGGEMSWKTTEKGIEIRVDDFNKSVYRSRERWVEISVAKAIADVLRAHEREVLAAITDTSVWTGASNYLDVSTAWTNSGADIGADLRVGRNAIYTKCGIDPLVMAGLDLTLVVSRNVFEAMSDNVKINDRVKYTQFVDGVLSRELVARALGVSRIEVAGAPYDTAGNNQAASLASLMGDDYAWIGLVSNSNDPADFCAGRTLWYDELGSIDPVAAGTPQELVVSEEYRDETVRSDIYRVRHHTHVRRMGSTGNETLAGFLFKID